MKGIPGITSKHQQFDRDGKFQPGLCRIFPNSSLRKLMRAARRNMVADDIQIGIDVAVRNAKKRARVYMHSRARLTDAMIGLGMKQRAA